MSDTPLETNPASGAGEPIPLDIAGAESSKSKDQPSGVSLLERIITEGKLVRVDPDNPIPATDTAKLDQLEKQKLRARALVAEFADQLTKHMAVNDDTLTMLQQQIAKIDELLSQQMNEILHAPKFQALEASWRGLHYLVTNTETGTGLKLRVMTATKKDLVKDLGTDFEQSQLFRKIYEEEYGTFGGHPFSLLIGDYEFTREPQDMTLLGRISEVAASAHAPFIAAASPQLFDMESFNELAQPRDLAKLFESTEMAEWQSFQATEDSRYVSLVLPHILLRLPYGPKLVPTDDFVLTEDTDGRDPKKYLWGNAAYALGQRITNAFSLYKWCAAIRGVEGGGVVRGLPTHTFHTDEVDKADGDKVNKSPTETKCPTEIAITDRRENELNKLGFISLCHCKGTNYAAFFGGQTTQKPKTYFSKDANANAEISARLPYVLAASRFAHYLKVICRDKIGSFQTKETLADFLNRWISNFILGTDNAGQELKAQYPLREARIDVTDVPGKPGAYSAVVFLRPHFQLEELTASIRLVAELPPPAAA